MYAITGPLSQEKEYIFLTTTKAPFFIHFLNEIMQKTSAVDIFVSGKVNFGEPSKKILYL